ncbi:MAG TPA: hypothetical protein VES39_03115 [Rhodospirillales bacterium]|nr:hypothetical protein [Rhodospirillales bacterium]
MLGRFADAMKGGAARPAPSCSAIAAEGGDVVGAATLGKSRFTASFAPQAETLARLRATFPNLEADWRTLTGAPFDALTDAEARYLLGFADEGALKEKVLGVATRRAVAREGPLAPPGTGPGAGSAAASAPSGTPSWAPRSAAELAEIERLRDALKAVPETRFDGGGLTAGTVRPAADLPGYVRDVAKGEPGGRALPRFLFSLGRWPGRLREQAAAFVARFGEVAADDLRISNQVIDKLCRQNGREADRLLAGLPDLLRDGEVLPNPQNPERVLLAQPFVRSTGQGTNEVAVVELARAADGYEIVSIHMSPDRTLAPARELAAAKRGGGGSGAGGAAGSSYGGSDVTTPAAADFPAVGTTSGSTVAPGQIAINWARIDGPDDIKLAMQQLADARAGEIDAARRGVRSHAEIVAEHGRDIEEVDCERAEDRRREQALGLTGVEDAVA